jgi:SAM-dependent methyltransferase
MAMTDVTRRFSSRVDNYVRYRPGYPDAIVETLRDDCGLTADAIVVDVGSGTGILTEMFLRHGNVVYGVEPNREMREAAERLLAGYGRFHSVAAAAEDTTLADVSVDVITAGQAFHWFDRKRARAEFARILKPSGWVSLIWNERTVSTGFLAAYEQVLNEYATDYEQVDHRRLDESVVRDFFDPATFTQNQFENQQVFDYDGLRGRLLSSSYAPEAGDPRHEPMLAELRRIFDAHQSNGTVVVAYVTQVYFGRLAWEHDGS